VVLVAPFVLEYRPDTRGIGLVREHESFTRLVADLVLIYALPLLVLAAAFARRLDVPRRYLAWAGTGLLVVLVLLAPWNVAGLLLVLVASAVAAHAAFDAALPQAERFYWLVAAVALALVAVGDFVYIRDAFDGTENYRFNTIFKAGYQAWYLFAIVAGVGLRWASEWLRGLPVRLWQASAVVLLMLLAVYPVAASYARTDGFSRGPTLDGLAWLEERAPGDVAAIEWLRSEVAGDPVVLEAVGPDYSPDGHARISTFTGLPTVVGWVGHELQWGHDPGRRARDVDVVYRTRDERRARRLLERYGVRYVVVGSLERQTYPPDSLAKFERLGRRVFHGQGTEIFALSA
jgi:YYY domain-containing protein